MFNHNGPNGSPYSSTSILNHFGDFGSKYAAYSVCNPYSSDPPVVVDSNGRYYGRFSVNQYGPARINDGKLLAWLSGMCAAH